MYFTLSADVSFSPFVGAPEVPIYLLELLTNPRSDTTIFEAPSSLIVPVFTILNPLVYPAMAYTVLSFVPIFIFVLPFIPPAN